jgi:uncharacterized OsmC-like protein
MNTVTMTSETPLKKAPPAPRNGVDTPALLATIGVVAGQPALAKFQFRGENQWLSGTHSRTTMASFFGAGAEQSHRAVHTADGDHPAVLCGADHGPTPVEWVLHALASCLTAGVGNIAAARGVTLRHVKSTVEGDIDLRGILGLSDEVRNGFSRIRVAFEIAGDAPPEKLRQIIEQARARSAVFDMLTNGLPVAVEIKSAD